MRGLSGIELQELLIEEGRRTPIIFVTALSDERIRDQVLDAGAFGFLRKPFSDEKLISCLEFSPDKSRSWAPAKMINASRRPAFFNSQ